MPDRSLAYPLCGVLGIALFITGWWGVPEHWPWFAGGSVVLAGIVWKAGCREVLPLAVFLGVVFLSLSLGYQNAKIIFALALLVSLGLASYSKGNRWAIPVWARLGRLTPSGAWWAVGIGILSALIVLCLVAATRQRPVTPDWLRNWPLLS